MELAPPQVPVALLARYRCEKLLASGGFGAVWRAHDIQANRPVALKVLHAESLADTMQVERFLQEARAASVIVHPAIVPVLAHGIEGNLPWIAYELIEGESLRDLMSRGPLPVGQALAIAEQLAQALSAAHERGIIHRDLKPDNVLMRNPQTPALTDFGIARWTGGRVKTQTGIILGTPLYMPLEVLKGEPPTPAADVYAAGVLLHEMLTGTLPVQGATPLEILRNLLAGTEISLSADLAAASPLLEPLVRKALAREPALRHADGAALAAELHAVRASLTDAAPDSPPPPSGKPSRTTGRQARTAVVSRGGTGGALRVRSRPEAPLARSERRPEAKRRTPMIALAFMAVLALLTGVALRRLTIAPGGPPPVLFVPVTETAADPLAALKDLEDRVRGLVRVKRTADAHASARKALDMVNAMPEGSRPALYPEVLAAALDDATAQLRAFNVRPPDDPLWLLAIRPEWWYSGSSLSWHVGKERADKKPAGEKLARLVELEHELSARTTGALARTLASTAPLASEEQLLAAITNLHYSASEWPDLPLITDLERVMETHHAVHPEQWSAQVLHMRCLVRSGAWPQAVDALLRAQERFEERHLAERRRGVLDADPACVRLTVACTKILGLKREGGTTIAEQMMNRVVAHLSGPPAAKPGVLEDVKFMRNAFNAAMSIADSFRDKKK